MLSSNLSRTAKSGTKSRFDFFLDAVLVRTSLFRKRIGFIRTKVPVPSFSNSSFYASAAALNLSTKQNISKKWLEPQKQSRDKCFCFSKSGGNSLGIFPSMTFSQASSHECAAYFIGFDDVTSSLLPLLSLLLLMFFFLVVVLALMFSPRYLVCGLYYNCATSC